MAYSFKTFLSENNTKTPAIYGIFFFKTPNSSSMHDFIKLLSKTDNRYIDILSEKQNEFEVLIEIKDQSEINDQFFINVKNKFIKTLSLKAEDASSVKAIYLSQMPKFKIDYDYIEIVCSSTEFTNLSNIHKVLNCKRLFLNNAHQINERVLSLLKIKDLISLVSTTTSFKWIGIINKHLKSKDLLSCQEELIENGLEQYAQL